MINKTLFIFLLIILACSGKSQRPIGSWQDYLSYSNATKVAVAGDRIYCLTDGGLFFLNISDNSINKFNALNGLSDFGIKTIAYSAENEVLVVAYKNSNIDLIYQSGVVNLADIKRKQMIGDKNIYNILFQGKTAYLSCGFGIVAINLEKREIKDTYIIGPGGTPVKINDTETDGQLLYAATDRGLYTAALNGTNLLDFNNWHKVETISRPSGKYSHVAFHSGSIVAVYTTDQWDKDELYRFKNGTWERYFPQIYYVYDMQVLGGYLTIPTRGDIYIIDSNHNLQGKVYEYPFKDRTVNDLNPRSAVFSVNSGLWVADYTYTLVNGVNSEFSSVVPEGPADNRAFNLLTLNNRLWVASGGRDDAWNNTWTAPKFQLYNQGQWQHYTQKEYPSMNNFFDMVNFAAIPSDPDHFYAGSWGGGVLEFQGDQLINRYTQANSTLQTALPQQPNEPYVRIGGLCFDAVGNLWVTNSEVPNVLSVLKSSGEWQSFNLPEIANQRSIGQLIVTQSEDKWIIVPRGHDVYVVNKDVTQKKYLQVTAYFNNGETELFTRMNDVYAIAEDHDGAVWLGTSKGVAVYYNAERIWEQGTMYATQPSLDLNDGLFHPLLETEAVTTIAVDGANRKWMGTKNSGVYLISDDGEKEILHFTQENSPLLSNNISSIVINERGEVFFGTSEGLISYQGDANQGATSFNDVYVYPNPVRETYSGPVVVTGLVEQTDVRITDISGNLVYKGESLGGQAVWNGKNLNGNRVKTGVYLVFCSDKKGTKTHVTKLLFIH